MRWKYLSAWRNLFAGFLEGHPRYLVNNHGDTKSIHKSPKDRDVPLPFMAGLHGL